MNIINPNLKLSAFCYQGLSAKQNAEPQFLTNNKKLEDDVLKMSELGKSQINFRGNFKLNKTDLSFLGTLAVGLGLSLEHFEKMKNCVANFLESNNLSSMDELKGEENLVKQCQLTEKMNEELDLNDEEQELLIDKVVERCENEFDYDENDLTLPDIEKAIKIGVQKQKVNDEKFINTIVTVLGLNSEQEAALRNIIDENIRKNHLISLQSLGENEDNIAAAMSEQIETKLGLTENEGLLISMELVHRAALGNDYEPQITSLDLNTEICHRDSCAYHDVIKNYTDSLHNIQKLHLAMKRDASKMNYDSIFELFNSNNNFKQFTETNATLNSIMSNDDKFNFIIDMFATAQNLDSINTKLKAEEVDKSDNIFKQYAAVCMLDDEFNLSESELKNIKNYLSSQKINFSDETSIYKAAYELTENKTFPQSAFDKIVEIISSTNNIPQDELLYYNFQYCQKIMDKK